MYKAVAPTELPDTKRKLLEAAVRLMSCQGFSATTVDEICAEAGLTKGSFFHYFASKDEIGEGALEHYSEQQREMFARAPFSQLADPLERLHGMLDFIGQNMGASDKVRGCLMGNLAQELAHTHPRIRACCEDKFKCIAGMVQAMLREAMAKHRPKAGFDPESVATLFVSLMQGSLLLAKTRQDKSVILENLEHFRVYVDTWFDQPRGR